MPRWKPLPDELDPQIREFTYQLRGLVDRSGMSVATIADRTGYSKSSWERYLGGRLLPPRGAAHALGRVTGMDIRHLETMWELAERAWSREEMRHDQTMNAVLVAQAREALGEFWDQERAKGRKWGRKGAGAAGSAKAAGAAENKAGSKGRGKAEADSAKEKPEEDWKERTGEHEIIALSADSFAPPSTSDLSEHTTVLRPIRTGGENGGRNGNGGRTGGRNGNGTGRDGGEGGGDGGDGPHGLRKGAGVPGQPPGAGLWGVDAADDSPRTVQMRPVAGAAPAKSGPKPASAPPAYPSSKGPRQAGGGAPAGMPGGEPHADHSRAPAPERSSRGRLVAALLGGMLSVFALLGAGVWVFGLPGESDGKALPKPPPSSRPDLPAGVKCQGESCSGKDPERMGCGGTNVKSSSSQFVGPSMVEVRYSEVCKAAWGRITGAAQGDTLKITAGGGQFESDEVGSTNDAYTEMVSVGSATEARACATLTVGRTGCTKAGVTAR